MGVKPFGKAKVSQHKLSSIPLYYNIFWFQISVNYVLAVQFFKHVERNCAAIADYFMRKYDALLLVLVKSEPLDKI